jgi:hypothetical protein
MGERTDGRDAMFEAVNEEEASRGKAACYWVLTSKEAKVSNTTS